MSDIPVKRCRKCQILKPATNFYGRKTICKSCDNARRSQNRRKQKQIDPLEKAISSEVLKFVDISKTKNQEMMQEQFNIIMNLFPKPELDEKEFEEKTMDEPAEVNDAEAGYVYFIRLRVPDTSSNHNHTKIGMTRGDPAKRLAQLQTGNANEMFVYKTIRTQFPTDLEKKIHEKLHKNRMTGEWFNVSEPFIDVICEHWGQIFY